MKKEITNKKMIIESLFITSLVISNVVTAKILQLGLFIVPGAVLLYAFTFTCTDLISELYGRKEAQKLVNTGFIMSIFAMIMIYLTGMLPSAPFALQVQDAYNTLLGTNFRIVAGSMLAYYISQTWDVWIFEKFKEKTNGKKKWIRNNLSTMTSQLLDTAIFITIAFIGNVPSIIWMIFSQYIVKLIIAALDTPIFYLLTRETSEVPLE